VALEGGLAVYLVTLPEGADPDSFVRQFGGEAFRNFLKRERQDFVTFLTAHARRSGGMDTPEGKAATARAVLEAVARVRDPIAQDAYLMRAAEELREPDTRLRQLMRRAPQRREEPPPASRPEDGPPPEAPAASAIEMRPEERTLLRLMLLHGEPMVEHALSRMALEEFSEGAVRALVAGLIAQFESGTVHAEPFLRGEFGEEVQRLAAEVLAVSREVSANWQTKVGVAVADELETRPFEAANSAMRYLKLYRVGEAIEALKQQLFVAERAGEDVTELQRRQVELDQLKKSIASGDFLEWNAA
jgi:DNA primase